MSFVFYTYFIILFIMIMIVIIYLIIIIIIIITIIFHKTVYEFMLISFFYLAKIAHGNGVMWCRNSNLGQWGHGICDKNKMQMFTSSTWNK